VKWLFESHVSRSLMNTTIVDALVRSVPRARRFSFAIWTNGRTTDIGVRNGRDSSGTVQLLCREDCVQVMRARSDGALVGSGPRRV